MSIDQQRKRDEITGFSFAPIIERDFRDIDLFVTRDHPSLALAKPWVVEVLRRIVSDQNLLVKVEHGLKDSPFPLDRTPIHPFFGHPALRTALPAREPALSILF